MKERELQVKIQGSWAEEQRRNFRSIKLELDQKEKSLNHKDLCPVYLKVNPRHSAARAVLRSVSYLQLDRLRCRGESFNSDFELFLINFGLFKMQIIRSPKRMQKICGELKRKSRTISLVPTMGYLHEGHLSLVRIAGKRSDVVVVSIFVNPTQFGPKEDFDRYPRDFKRDRLLLEQEGCDFIFAPRIKEIYPEGYLTYVEVEELTGKLEGASRPGHFRGVTTIVAKLLNIVQPDVAVFGQKDAQQAVVLKKMVEDLDYGTRMIIAPTVREKDGLALSSRNKYLSQQEKKQAAVLSRSLREAEKLIGSGERKAAKIITRMRNLIKKHPLAKLEYVAITDARSMKLLTELRGDVLISLAVRFGKTRLIDNTKIKVS